MNQPDRNAEAEQQKLPDSPPVVALTGGIASGKTAASDAFAALGVEVVDTDLLAREVVEPGSDGLDALIEAFGAETVDANGALDRQALRQRVFSNPDARARLDGILHPLIEKLARKRLARATGPYAILVVPLLVETGLFGDADRVLVVDVPESTQIERLTSRDRVDPAQARRMLAAQASRAQRLAAADDVIENTGSLEELGEQVAMLDRRYRRIGHRAR